ncbi:protein-export chaperone SecB [Desulfocurvus vexinensis]|uniref:protein-export chaperone SecB n=1 Tax=Desulfocurvus vexinensis TaxID=399548 RepID=UPI000A0084F0|nr:protein-export chaperone SecB [Desulfocurvus vexinensis]
MEVTDVKKPPLEMKEHFFTKVSFAANDSLTEEDVASSKPFEHDFKCFVEVLTNNKDPLLHQVRLKIVVAEKEDALKAYDIEIEVVGLFRPTREFDTDEELKGMIQIIGATLLYGAAREYIYSLTLRGPWPPVYLPTTSFIPAQSAPSPGKGK